MTEESKSRRKVKEGIVVSNKMQKTVTVKVIRMFKHPHFDKVVTRGKKYYAHINNEKEVQVGQTVQIEETRPLSKLKRWRVLSVVV